MCGLNDVFVARRSEKAIKNNEENHFWLYRVTEE